MDGPGQLVNKDGKERWDEIRSEYSGEKDRMYHILEFTDDH